MVEGAILKLGSSGYWPSDLIDTMKFDSPRDLSTEEVILYISIEALDR